MHRPSATLDLIVLSLAALTLGCVSGPDPSCTDPNSSSIELLPEDPQVLAVGERRSIWIMATPDRREPIDVELSSGRAIRELSRERLFGSHRLRIDVEGIRPGTATLEARLQCGEPRRTTLTVLAQGTPRCETEGPPPYCIEGRYRVRATELNDRCTGSVDAFESEVEIVRSLTDPIGARLGFGDGFSVSGQIGPDGVFFTEFPHFIGRFRDGREVVLEPTAISMAGFRVRGHLDVIGLFPSPDPVDFAPCERKWVLEGERL